MLKAFLSSLLLAALGLGGCQSNSPKQEAATATSAAASPCPPRPAAYQ